MSEQTIREYHSYDYMEVSVAERLYSHYMDSYQAFGWEIDENIVSAGSHGKITIHLKRSRRIMNKMELTRLQRHFEACMEEIVSLEESRRTYPRMTAFLCGLSGWGFMAGSVFAATANPPRMALCLVLAVPGFIFCAAAYFGYHYAKHRRIKKTAPLIEAKFDEAYEVCEKANKLINA